MWTAGASGTLGKTIQNEKILICVFIVKISLTWLRRASAVWGVVATFKSWWVGCCVGCVFICVCVCAYLCSCWLLWQFWVHLCVCVFVPVLVVVLVMYLSPASRDSSRGRIDLGRWTWAPERCSLQVYRWLLDIWSVYLRLLLFLLECVSHREFSILPPGSSMGRDAAEGVAIQGRGL